MQTLSEFFKHSSAYWGERSEWLVVATKHRDSEALTESNFRTLARDLVSADGGETKGFQSWGTKGSTELSEHVAIEEATHWAVGWLQYLIISPSNAELVAKAETMLERLEGYPAHDESDWCELEDEQAQAVWRDCYNVKDRIEYIREHRNQFEFRGLADLLGCARGKYFCGYASEILN